MDNNFDNILPPNNADNQKRLEELNDALKSSDLFSEEEEDFEKDANEGLQQISQTNVAKLVTQLNVGLQKQLKPKKKIKRKIVDQTMVYITIVTLLLMVVVAYFVIKKIMG